MSIATRDEPTGEQQEAPATEVPSARSSRRGVAWTAFGAFLVFSAFQLGISIETFTEAAPRAQFVWTRLWPPQIQEPQGVFLAAVESLQIAIVGTAFGILMSLVLAFLAARNVTPFAPLGYAIKAFAGLVRAVPALVWALLFIMAVGLGPTPGILALAVNSIGMLVKVYAETIEEIPMGPVEALRASGANGLQVAVQGVLPSVIRTFIAWSIFRLDVNVRYSAILGVVGAGGIGWELVRASTSGRYDDALGVTFVIFAMVMLAEVGSQWLRNRVDE